MKAGLFTLLSATILTIEAQIPTIEWEVNIGGDGWDECRSVFETTDGGFICGGFSESDVSGNKTAPSYGQYDFYAVKLDIFGNVEWEKSYGGDQREQMYRAEQTADGGYIMGGWSESEPSGNKTAPLYGERDCWVIKTDADGEIEWQTTVGGDVNDYIFTLHQLSDGGYIFGGFSDSNLSGTKTEPNLGLFDYYIFKLDADGNLVWQNTLGGPGDEKLHAIVETQDGGFICGGTSETDTSADKSAALIGLEDYWVLKLDAWGNIEWDRTYGGFDVEELFDIQQDTEGNYIIAGFTTSSMTGDVTEPIIGMQDGWAVKLDNSGDIVWENMIGGDMGDRLECAYVMNDGNYFMGSGSFSPISGDQIETSWDWDYWLKKLDQATGDILWQVNLGGYGIDLPRTIIQTNDGSFAACGESTSNEGEEKNTPNYGNYDYWIVKTTCEFPFLHYADADGDGFGNNDVSINTCTNYPGYVLNNTDCNDADAAAYPGATEVCNALDDNCNGDIDEGALAVFYADTDADGFGDADITITDCPAPVGYVDNAADCDDTDGDINPDATETCNGLDDNCNASIDEGVLITYYVDADGDSYGDPLITTEDCSVPAGYADNDTDCDDTNADVSPGDTEVCNDIDDNCNEETDEGVLVTFYEDADGDDFGNAENTTLGCTAPTGFVADDTDCDDTNSEIYPGAEETLNGLDDNCNEMIDEGLTDINEIDAANFSIFPNPVTNDLIIMPYLQNSAEKEIHISDVAGKVVKTYTGNDPMISLNVEELASGFYLVVINENNVLHLLKFVKE